MGLLTGGRAPAAAPSEHASDARERGWGPASVEKVRVLPGADIFRSFRDRLKALGARDTASVNLRGVSDVEATEETSFSHVDPTLQGIFMKRLILRTLALVVAVGALPLGVLLHAQDLTGTWQGALQLNGKELRTVIRITKEDTAF